MGGLLKEGENKARGRAFDKRRTLNLEAFLLDKDALGECLAGSPTHSPGEGGGKQLSPLSGLWGDRRETR